VSRISVLAEQHAALIGLFQAGDHAQQRRLAEPDGPSRATSSPAGDVERDAAQGSESVEALLDDSMVTATDMLASFINGGGWRRWNPSSAIPAAS
jgi:hypothetical protein